MDDHKFEVHCNAGGAGQLHAKTGSVSVRIGQRVLRNGAIEILDCIIIVCEETRPGTLSAKVIVCHPDWDQHVQIAHLQSSEIELNPSVPALEFDLKQIRI